MNRFTTSFRQLRWKLTFSYTLVTVAALLVVEALAVGGALVFLLNGQFMPRLASQVMVASASDAAPFLTGGAPDLEGLNEWLLNAAINGLRTSDDGSRSQSFTLGSLAGQGAHFLVLDKDRVLLAVAPPGSRESNAAIGAPYPATPQQAALLDLALAGESDSNRLFNLTPANHLYIAAPIHEPGGRVVGVLAFSGLLAPLESPFEPLLTLLGVSLVVFTLAAGVVGTAFGSLTARGLSHRLHTLTQAADNWSRGEFSVFVTDRSGDELGQLARRLNRMAEQLQNLLQTHAELATLEERNRLARDLHDSVKQQVFATAMQVGAARALIERDPQAAQARLTEAEALARQAQAELTVLIRELRPAALQGQGLAEALGTYLEAWSRQTGIPIDISRQGERSLPLPIELALFRVAQEALANVARHSRAGQVTVHLAYASEQVTLTISDNGSGFDPRLAGEKGLGLHSMQERLALLGGELEIQAAPGQGTQLVARAPLRN